MNMKCFVVPVAACFAVMAAIVSGCAGARVDLVDAGVLTIEQQTVGKVGIAWSSAYKDKGGLVVTGVLTRDDHVGLPIRAHVDISVFLPDGRTLQESRTPDIYVPVHVHGRGRSLKRFEVRFPRVPPRGSSVRLVCHSDPH